MIYLYVFFLVAGITLIVFPYVGWYVSFGWRLKDEEPSDLALVAQRLVGVGFTIIGLFFILHSWTEQMEKNLWLKTWTNYFKSNLTEENVSHISLKNNSQTLTDEEKRKIIALLQESDIQYYNDKSDSSSQASNSILIEYTDGSNTTIEVTQNGFLIKPRSKVQLKLSNHDLKRWLEEKEQRE